MSYDMKFVYLNSFLLKKKKKYGSVSAYCSSKFSKLIVRASSLEGVPVFSLPNLKSYFSNCSLKPVEGFSSNLPAGSFCSPICIRPLRNVPVVRIILEDLSLCQICYKSNYIIILKINLITESEKMHKLQ